jgi:hypothetical protein
VCGRCLALRNELSRVGRRSDGITRHMALNGWYDPTQCSYVRRRRWGQPSVQRRIDVA